MAPKKKPDTKDEAKADPDQRPRGAADRALEQAEEEVAAKREEVSGFVAKHEENERRVKQIKELEARMPDLEEKQRRAYARFRKCLIPDRPESAASSRAAGGGHPSEAATSKSIHTSPNPAETQALHHLHQEAQDAVLGLLSTYYKKPRTRKEVLCREQAAADDPCAQTQRKPSAAGAPKPDPKAKPKGKGGVPEDDALLSGPDVELRCPIGISGDVFDKVLRCRLDRILVEEELEQCRAELKPLREAAVQAKAEQVGKQQVAKGKRQLAVLEQRLEECRAKVQQEDDEFRREREVELWRANQRAQSAEDGGKRPPSAKKK